MLVSKPWELPQLGRNIFAFAHALPDLEPKLQRKFTMLFLRRHRQPHLPRTVKKEDVSVVLLLGFQVSGVGMPLPRKTSQLLWDAQTVLALSSLLWMSKQGAEAPVCKAAATSER